MVLYEFEIPGEPKTKGRPRTRVVTPKGGKPFATHYTPQRTKQHENRVADLALSAGVELIPKPTPVGVEITFFRPRPKRVCRVKDPDGSIICAVRPDIDNLMKAVLDGLDGVAWQDDGQICDVVLRKRYHAKDAAARTVVRIEAIEDEVDR